MIKKLLVVTEKHGIHARPALKIAKVCQELDSKVTFFKKDQKADGRSILQVMLLAAEQGAVIEVVVEGGDETTGMNRISELFENGGGI
jgi:phosphocarrier protein